MIIKILNSILMIFGLIIMIFSIYDYFKITKVIENKETNKLDKVQTLLNILICFSYFVIGLLVFLELTDTRYIFNYVLIIIILEKIIRFIITKKYKKR